MPLTPEILRVPPDEEVYGLTNTIPALNAVAEFERRAVFIPLLRRLDPLINRLDRQVWDCVYPRFGNNLDTDTLIRSPDCKEPSVVRRNMVLERRNEIAAALGIPLREKNDLSNRFLQY